MHGGFSWFFCPHWDVTFLQGQISNLCREALPLSSSLPPLQGKSWQKNAQVFKQSSPWMKIKKILLRKQFHWRYPCIKIIQSHLAEIYLHCVCSMGLYCKLLKTKQNKTKPLPLHWIVLYIYGNCSFSFLWLQQKNKSIYTAVGFVSQVWSISTS